MYDSKKDALYQFQFVVDAADLLIEIRYWEKANQTQIDLPEEVRQKLERAFRSYENYRAVRIVR
jgi:hypothetical protein